MNILVTGGAGFIGSNLVQALLTDQRTNIVRVLDDLSTGNYKNIEPFITNTSFEFIKGDIRDFETCNKACKDIHLISHQAALGSVPRSVNDPITTNDVNITGTLNIFKAAVDNNVARIVFAASSSTYGDSEGLPKVEHIIGQPLSPYAVTKYVNELYAKAFSTIYDFNYIGLRYFNVFGPNQDPNGAYAAVVPLFFEAAIQNKPPTINGDGSFSRDFTYVENAVQANILSLFTNNPEATNQVYNVACGDQTSLKEIWTMIKEITGSITDPIYGPERVGDIPHSLANIEKIKTHLGYKPSIKTRIGLQKLYTYLKSI